MSQHRDHSCFAKDLLSLSARMFWEPGRYEAIGWISAPIQSSQRWTASEYMQEDRAPPCFFIYATAVVLSDRLRTDLPLSWGRKAAQVSWTALFPDIDMQGGIVGGPRTLNVQLLEVSSPAYVQCICYELE